MTLTEKRSILPLLAISLGLIPVFAGDLGVKFQRQEQDNWCWAASDAMVVDYLRGSNTALSQCNDANFAYPNGGCGIPGRCCFENYSACNLQCTTQIRASGFTSVSEITPPFIWSTITAEISNNRPFLIEWIWQTGGSHIMVGAGFTTDRVVNVVDPLTGMIGIPFSSAFVLGSDKIWTHI